MILADLVSDGDRVFVADADLMLHCLDTGGTVRWRDSILDRTTINGIRVNVDQIAGGAYYQSKPTVAEGKVFVGTPSRFVYAIDEGSGQLCWKFEFGGAISAAPNYDQGRLFLGQQGGEDDYYCLDARSGELYWRQSIGWVWGSSNVAQGRVFVPGIDGFVNCLDAHSGAILWRYRTGRSTCTEPVIDGDIVFFGGWDGYLYAFDILTGEVLWQFHLGGSSDSGAQMARDGLLYVPLGSGKLRCIDPGESMVRWEYAIDRGNLNASPAFDGKRVYISAMQGAGMGGIPIVSHIHCLDAVSGELVWVHPGGGLTAPAIAQDKAYFGSTFAPYFTCVDARGTGDGSTRLYWKVQMGGKVEESCTALANGRAYLQASDGYLYAIC
jgi:outer membrane protein assembly factor BamB